MAEVAELLAPIDGDSRVGEDLSYDGERVEIEAAFERAAESDDTEGEADPIDWRATLAKIVAQSDRTKDIWLPVYMMRAGAKAGQLDAVETGAQYLGGLLEEYWPDAHPQLDEYGFQGRKAPCEGLVRIGEFLGPLRSLVLLRHPRLGSYSGADFARFRDGGAAEDGYGMFRAAIEDVGDEGLAEVLAKLDRIIDGIKRADVVLTGNADGDTAPNFTATYDTLAEIRRGVAAFTSAGAGDSEIAAAADESPTPGRRDAADGPSLSGSVNSREDVLKAIDAIIDYYRRREPTSPVPLALRRARDWVTADFLTVLEDIAVGSLDEVRRVLVSQRVVEEPASDY